MPPSKKLRRVALVRADVSEEHTTIIKVTRIGELGTALAETSNRITLCLTMEAIRSSETSYKSHTA
jgi:hypothetical protein